MIGIVGLGNMGRAIAERLLDEGETLTVWNRTPEKAEGLAAKIAESPAEVAAASQIVISVLGNDDAIEDVYFGKDGFCSGGLGGAIIVEFCTTLPDTVARLEREVEAAGGRFLECPVGGTIGPAREGKLLGMAGGKREVFDIARPVLDRLTRRLDYLGPVGNGAAMKLAINLPLMVYWAAVGEALGLVLDRGIDPYLAADILADSTGAIAPAKARLPRIVDMVVQGKPPAGVGGLALYHGLKDMTLMETLAEVHGRRHEVISACKARAEAAAQDGFLDLDTPLIAAFGQKRDFGSG